MINILNNMISGLQKHMKILIGGNQLFNQMMNIFHIQLEQVQFIFRSLLKKWQLVEKTA